MNIRPSAHEWHACYNRNNTFTLCADKYYYQRFEVDRLIRCSAIAARMCSWRLLAPLGLSLDCSPEARRLAFSLALSRRLLECFRRLFLCMDSGLRRFLLSHGDTASSPGRIVDTLHATTPTHEPCMRTAPNTDLDSTGRRHNQQKILFHRGTRSRAVASGNCLRNSSSLRISCTRSISATQNAEPPIWQHATLRSENKRIRTSHPRTPSRASCAANGRPACAQISWWW